MSELNSFQLARYAIEAMRELTQNDPAAYAVTRQFADQLAQLRQDYSPLPGLHIAKAGSEIAHDTMNAVAACGYAEKGARHDCLKALDSLIADLRDPKRLVDRNELERLAYFACTLSAYLSFGTERLEQLIKRARR
jgi:hypothetical protein